MNPKIFLLISAFALISFASAIQQPLIYYKLNLDYSYGNISINSTEIEFSNEQIEPLFGFYSIIVKDSNDEILNITFFDVPNEILYDTADENGTINGGGFLELNETNFDILVPYYENAKEIVIYSENLTEMARKDVSEFSKVYIQETGILRNETTPRENIEIRDDKLNLTEKLASYWWVLLVILILLVIILINLLTKKK